MGTRKRFFIMKTVIFLAFVGLVSGQIDGRPEWTPRSGNGTCAEMPEFMLNADRIVGGEDAPSPIPWQVAVLSGSFQFCGATILDESTLLCAAHCQVSTSHSIRAGSVNRKSGGQVRNIAQVMNNIQYNPNTLENDFAILKLDSPLELNDDVKPACLPTSSDYLDVSSTEEECFTSGWGTLSSGGFSTDACQFVRVPAITNAECNADYGGSIADSMICAGYPGEGGKDACQGDSGGPFVCNHEGKAVVAGVVSWGNGCALADFPGVYARTTYVLDWIQANLGPPGPPGPTTAPPTGCVSPQWAQDDYCDDENNNAECNWDGGACCNNNAAGWNNYCSACECLDHNAGSGPDCEDKWKTKKCKKQANKGKCNKKKVKKNCKKTCDLC